MGNDLLFYGPVQHKTTFVSCLLDHRHRHHEYSMSYPSSKLGIKTENKLSNYKFSHLVITTVHAHALSVRYKAMKCPKVRSK